MKDQQNSYRNVLRVCLVIAVASILFLLRLDYELTSFSLLPHSSSASTDKPDLDFASSAGFLVRTNGCRIAALDPMDESVRQYIGDEEALRCAEQFGPALVESNVTSLYVNVTALSHYGVNDSSDLECCYTPFWREEVEETLSGNYPDNVDSRVRYANFCTPFHMEAKVDAEFVKIECFFNSSLIYIDYHAFVPVKKDAARKIATSEVSVLIIGVDAVSRLNLHRQMPNTVKFLKKNLSGVEFLGYNKVADNTFPNLIPTFTGLSEGELKENCWLQENYVFDNCNFIWNNFSAAGYKTAFAEDASWMGIFKYVKKGFRKQPTDYYMRVFNMVAEDKIGFEKRLNAKLCIGPRKTVETLLSYAYKFAVSLKEFATFGFFWGTSLSHDFLNLPKQGDQDHVGLFERLYEEGVFNRTVLVFMSDHGIRWGKIRKTYQGYLEERLPFLFIAYPDWFRVKYTSAIGNLKRNAMKLTTPFDLHETLLDLVDLKRLESKELRKRSESLVKAKTLPRGISLFLPVSGSRSCQDAGIVDHWCTCNHGAPVPTNDTRVISAGVYLTTQLNSYLAHYPQCRELTLNKIIGAREEKSLSHTKFSPSDAGITDYSLTVETVPGKALFEANIRYNGNSGNFTLVGTVSRINLYGNQSSCVPHYKLRLYCYCNH